MTEDRIEVIESTLVQARNTRGDHKAERLKLVADLKAEVRKLAETCQDDASGIMWFAEASTHEVSRSQKNAQLAGTALHGLHLSVQGLDESRPVIVGIVNRFATALSNMGL